MSALDTSTLLSYTGKEAHVEGIVTYTGIWSPTSNQAQQWAFIFFAKDVNEAGFPGYTALGQPLDFSSYFRAIVKSENLLYFSERLRVWNQFSQQYELKTKLIVKKDDNILLSGKIDGYRSAPVIYLTNRNQLTIK